MVLVVEYLAFRLLMTLRITSIFGGSWLVAPNKLGFEALFSGILLDIRRTKILNRLVSWTRRTIGFWCLGSSIAESYSWKDEVLGALRKFTKVGVLSASRRWAWWIVQKNLPPCGRAKLLFLQSCSALWAAAAFEPEPDFWPRSNCFRGSYNERSATERWDKPKISWCALFWEW